MSVWYICPSARPPEDADKCLAKWRDKGYKLAVFRDAGAQPVIADLLLHGQYLGYARAVNMLIARVMQADPDAAWMIAGNDDQYPDPQADPAVIAAECMAHFGGTFGVMQPAGDKYGAIKSGSSIVSPWMGRDWCRRLNEGRGPLWEEYFHFFEDAEHKEVAVKLGRLLLREDLSHYHDHWERFGRELPPHLVKAKAAWQNSRNIFRRRKSQGFPGSDPLDH